MLPTNGATAAEMKKDPFYWVLLVLQMFIAFIMYGILHELIVANGIKKWQLEQDRTISVLQEEKGSAEMRLAASYKSLLEKIRLNRQLSEQKAVLEGRVLAFEQPLPLRKLHGRAITVVYQHHNKETEQGKVLVAQNAARKPAAKVLRVVKAHTPKPAHQVASKEPAPAVGIEAIAVPTEKTVEVARIAEPEPASQPEAIAVDDSEQQKVEEKKKEIKNPISLFIAFISRKGDHPKPEARD